LLEISGKRGGRIAVANQSVEQRRLEVDLDRRQIALNVRESYWKAKAMQALAVLYDEDARYFRQVIDYHEARFREGKLAEVDLLRVRLQGQQIQAAAANARLDSEKAILILAQEMWLCIASTSMPCVRRARSTGLTSVASRTKSPEIAALPWPVGWKLIAVAVPMAGGTSIPLSLIFSMRGTENCRTPPFAFPA
jgi:hypothetical protein